MLREGSGVVAAAMIVAPVLLLPGLAWGAAGRLSPVEYPADWLAARRLINSDATSGKALLLPWGAYRRFSWNHGTAVLDPWPRLLARTVVWDDGVQVGSTRIPPEDPASLAVSRLITAGSPLTRALRADGYRYVIVDVRPAHGGLLGTRPDYPFVRQLPGCQIVLAGPDLVIYRIPASISAASAR